MSAANHHTAHPPIEAIWMRLHNRQRLATLMLIQGVTQRDLAAAAGWKSHSYLGRLIRGDVTTLDVEPAVRIAHRLGVAVDDLFTPRTSSEPHHTVKGDAA